MKVERIGNMNYPQEAKDKGVNGSLMLSVDIKPDGSVPPMALWYRDHPGIRYWMMPL